MQLLGIILYQALNLYLFVLVARMVLSWIPLLSPGWQPKGALLVVAEVIYTLTDPPLKAIGKVIPPVRVGSVALDVGFLLLWFGVIVVQRLIVMLMYR